MGGTGSDHAKALSKETNAVLMVGQFLLSLTYTYDDYLQMKKEMKIQMYSFIFFLGNIDFTI